MKSIHSSDSLVGCRSTQLKRILIFNCSGGRAGQLFLEAMVQTMASRIVLAKYDVSHPGLLLDHVIFCTNITTPARLESDVKKAERDTVAALTTQHEFAEAWKQLVPAFPKENSHVLTTIQDAVDLVGTLHDSAGAEQDMDVLVIGSLHLVGGLIGVAKLEDRAFS